MTPALRHELGIIGGGVAVQMARPALAAYSRVAIHHLGGNSFEYPEFDFVAEVGELLDPRRVQAIYIATPVHLHVDFIKQAIRAGLPVLVEKPLGIDADDVGRLGSADTSRVAVAFRKRYSDLAAALRAARNNGYGPFSLKMTWFAPHPGVDHWKAAPSRTGGGVCLDLASHAFDLVEFCLGRVTAIRVVDYRVRRDTEADEYVQVVADVADGSQVRLELGWATGTPLEMVTVASPSSHFVWVKEPASTESVLVTASRGEVQRATCHRSDEYARMFRDFDAFAHGGGHELATWQDGVRNLGLITQVLTAIYSSDDRNETAT